MANCCRILMFICLLASGGAVLAHGADSHGEKPDRPSQVPASETRGDANAQQGSTTAPVVDGGSAEPGTVEGDSKAISSGITVGGIIDDLTWSEFPTLHPMIVHVPVTFIPLALLFSLISLFAVQRTFVWLAAGFIAAGLAGGFVAAFPMHPHTSGLTEAAKLTLQKHDFFAYSTLWLTLAALVVALVCSWKPLRLAKIGLSLMLLLSSLSVSLTGHYGGTLAYVHGVGSQGRFLSSH